MNGLVHPVPDPHSPFRGNTGLVAGAVPEPGDVLLPTTRLDRIGPSNAGGIRVLNGMTRAQVPSVDALDVAGRPLARLHPLVKDDTCYAMSSLPVGSEGTLGAITQLLLRLLPLPSTRAVVLLGLPSLPAALDLPARVPTRLPLLRAVEDAGQ